MIKFSNFPVVSAPKDFFYTPIIPPGKAGAGGRGGSDHPLELPLRHAGLEVGSRPGCWLHTRPQARRAHPALRAPHGRAHQVEPDVNS